MNNLSEENLQTGNIDLTTETEHLNIYKKMFEVMKAVNGVEKDGTNDYHNYDYVKEEDVVKEMKKQLIKQNVHYNSTVIAQKSDGNYREALVRFILTDLDSGEQFIAQYWGEGMDKGDKGYYKAYAGATKYFFMKNFLLASGDDPEADTSTDKHAYGNKNNRSRNKNRSSKNRSSKNRNNNSKSNSNSNKGNSQLANKLQAKMNNNKQLEKVANKFLKMLNKDGLSDLSDGELQALKNKLNQAS